MDKVRYDQLSSLAIFGGLAKATLKSLLEDAVVVHRATGECFFLAGDLGDSLFLIETGEVDVVRELDGTEYVLAHLVAGDCFGEMALVEVAPRSAGVRATCECRALEFHSKAIAQLATRDLEQFTLLQMNLGREIARRLRKADERLFAARIGRD